MQTVDRQGIHIDQCDRCRGVFLDAGELEQIAQAEERHYAAPPPYTPPPGSAGSAPPPGRYGGYRDSPPPYGRSSYGDSPPPHQRRRKRSFLEGLFD